MLDIKDLSESCGQNPIFRIMNNNGITAVRGYKEHKDYGRGRPQIVSLNHLAENTPDTFRVTEISYINPNPA